MDNSKYFYLSGFISLTLFFSFALLFAYILFNDVKIKSYGLKKENYISVSITLPKPKQPKKIKKHSKKIKSVPVAAVSSEPSKDIDINDLFSDVWTQKISTKKKKRKINSKRISQLQKRIKKTKENKVEKISQKLEDIENIKSPENRESSSANEVNEYLAKIQALVYKYFHVPPNSAGNSVKTVIELDPLGKVIDFRVLTYSANEALNSEADKIKERLKNVIFPKNPSNQSSKTVVILISKE